MFWPDARLFFVKKDGTIGQLTQTLVYVDYLNMPRIGGEWRIVNKIYTSRPVRGK